MAGEIGSDERWKHLDSRPAQLIGVNKQRGAGEFLSRSQDANAGESGEGSVFVVGRGEGEGMRR